MKQKFIATCPCNDVEFKITYVYDDELEIFCPFCSSVLEEPVLDDEDE